MLGNAQDGGGTRQERRMGAPAQPFHLALQQINLALQSRYSSVFRIEEHPDRAAGGRGHQLQLRLEGAQRLIGRMQFLHRQGTDSGHKGRVLPSGRSSFALPPTVTHDT